MLRNGADINQMDNTGKTALHHAALEGKKKVTGLLISHGAVTTLVDSQGKTALNLAAQKGSILGFN